MVILAIANGALREVVIRRFVSELTAHQLSTLSLAIIFTLYTWIVLRRFRPESGAMAAGAGVLWLALTLLFEFGFGHYIAGHSWTRLLSEYNLADGRVWVFVPFLILALPYLVFRLNSGQRGSLSVR